MGKKVDLRIIKTQAKLTDALGSMMKEMPFDDVTVFELCENAGVRRATFYKHYNDKYDFLKSIVNKQIADIASELSSKCDLSNPVEYFVLYVKGVIKYFEDRPEILSNILESSAFHVIFDIITSCTHVSLISNINDAKIKGADIHTDTEITASFINGGIATLLLSWFRTKHISEEALISEIQELLKKFFV